MVLNTLADLAIGAVPLLGDVVDVAFRSNRANLELLRRHAANPEASTRGDQAVVAGIVLIAVGLVVLVLMALGALLAIEIPPP